MKKIVILAMMLMGIILGACTNEDDAKNVEGQMGSIYGIVTELGTSEPMKSIGVELYKSEKLLLKTVTFDDGHFEFIDLVQGDYQVNVVSDEYEQTEKGLVTVEAGRQARIDLQIKKREVHAKAYTSNASVSGNQVTLNGGYTEDYDNDVSEAGFIYATNNNLQNGRTVVKCKKDEIEEVNYVSKLSTTISDLPRGTYYYQAYATTRYGTAYGEILLFNITGAPGVTTLPPTNIMQQSATLNGQIVFEGEPAYTERGFVYSEIFNLPTVDDPVNVTAKVAVAGRSKEFAANIASLTENIRYYVRAYAIYEGGTVYGEVHTFKPEHPDYIIIDNLMIQKKDLGKTNLISAIELCESSRIAGFSDWHLPTLSELSFIYQHRDAIPNLTRYHYWSSTGGNGVCYAISFESGNQFSVNSYNVHNSDFYVRAVRTIK